ncbi:MAG: hypothetical protein A2342_03820 [Gallionellales bacterium RIFOXYB12_FULL_54_9]|nr:MAG: hypothetical protein A2342_03820 [Gallionellales bacterium RIFOXYB12_FULL_54_9]
MKSLQEILSQRNSTAPFQPVVNFPACLTTAESRNHHNTNINDIVEQPAHMRSATVETLLRHVEPFQPDTGIDEIIAHFCSKPSLRAVPIVTKGRPVGLITRQQLFTPLDRLIHREHPNITREIMNTVPLRVEKSTPIHELTGFLSESDIQHFIDGFIITEQGRYIGTGSGQDLLREISKLQIETARYANPLTRLPGNIPVDEHIERLLHTEKPYTICHANLDNFRSFNSEYGYHKGDELIQFTGTLLSKICHPKHDFIGHLNGDNFTLIMQSPDWELRCNRALADFAQTSPALFNKAHRNMGGYKSEDRQGRLLHHLLPTLSLGAIRINPKIYSSYHEILDAANDVLKIAKIKPGNSLFIERRDHQHRELRNYRHA